MSRFDTLWYHMPFAARFAQTGSVTGIQFTQADPFTAYYPANSELLHAVGISALHSDLASPLLNLMWLAIALLAGWCTGRPWQVERLTLITTCLLLSTPVMGVTQPGEAFNDVVGLAALLAAVAFLVNFPHRASILAVVGLALGLAVGTKLTFIVPALVLTVGLSAVAAPGGRIRVGCSLLAPLVLTSGWWYLRNLIAVGNPLGLRLHVGPLVLPGPASALATASEQTVFSELRHPHFLASRFIPGLDRGLGPLWAVILLSSVAAAVAGVVLARSPTLRVIALTAIVSGVSYLFAPTGATDLASGSALFAENLRYAMPALALGIVLAPILVALHAHARLPLLAPILALVAALTQLQHSLWPTQTARHLAFTAAVLAVIVIMFMIRRRGRAQPPAVVGALGVGLLILTSAALFIVQRHYFDQRYRLGVKSDPGLGAIYRWSQGVAHARIALYGTVEQYPLYGAFDTNRVTYLGSHTTNGGYVPIASCSAWRAAISSGRYQYLVLTPAPTAAPPLAWSTSDAALDLVLHPSPSDFVFRVTSPVHRPC
jgi:hypothetical protein